MTDADEERWCERERERVIAYLKHQRLYHGAVGEWPAWSVHPHVAVWAVESVVRPGWVGWWVISGDLPTDYKIGGAGEQVVLAPLLAVRADLLLRWAEEEEIWQNDADI